METSISLRDDNVTQTVKVSMKSVEISLTYEASEKSEK